MPKVGEAGKGKPRSGYDVFLGIDPGASGGLAVLVSGAVGVTPMPKTERDVWEWVLAVSRRGETFAVIEKVHAMPGNGVSGMFKFGMGYGGLRMALIAAGVPFEDVTPQAWQKSMGITQRGKTETKPQFKNRLKAKAQQLFPEKEVTLSTADALLIAEYARRKMTGIL